MTAAYFEEHPTDPDKVIMRKPPHDIDLFWRAATTPEKWVGLTDDEIDRVTDAQWGKGVNKPIYAAHRAYARAIEQALKEKNT